MTSEVPSTVLLSAHGLSCRRGGTWLFRDVDLQLRSSRLTWLKGANGSGKTTLMRVIAGLTRPETGEVQRSDPEGGLLYLGHANALKSDFSAREALMSLADTAGLPVSVEQVGQALGRLGLSLRAGVAVGRLSQGQRRRVALSRLALLPSPALWVLDEPFDALDTDGISRVDGLIREHLARGGSVLMTSHLPALVGAPAADVVQLGGAA